MCVGAWVSGCGWVVGRGCVWLGLGTCEYVHFCAHVCTCVHMCAIVCTCVYVRTYMCAHGAVLGSSVDVRGWLDGWLRVAVGGCGWVRMCELVDGGGCGWLWVGVGVRGDI